MAPNRWVKQSERLAAEAAQPDNTPKLDLGFKEGQTIHINISKVSEIVGLHKSSDKHDAGSLTTFLKLYVW